MLETSYDYADPPPEAKVLKSLHVSKLTFTAMDTALGRCLFIIVLKAVAVDERICRHNAV